MKIEKRTKNGWLPRGSVKLGEKPTQQSDIVDDAAKRWAEFHSKRRARIEGIGDKKLKASAKLAGI